MTRRTTYTSVLQTCSCDQSCRILGFRLEKWNSWNQISRGFSVLTLISGKDCKITIQQMNPKDLWFYCLWYLDNIRSYTDNPPESRRVFPHPYWHDPCPFLLTVLHNYPYLTQPLFSEICGLRSNWLKGRTRFWGNPGSPTHTPDSQEGYTCEKSQHRTKRRKEWDVGGRDPTK